MKIIGEFPNLLNAVRFEVLSGEMKGKKIVFNKFKCTTDLLQKLQTTEEKKPRTLSNIHKLKRENRVLSSRIKAIEDSAYIGNELSHKDLYFIKLLSQRIGSNGNKIQRLRTKLSQLNKAGQCKMKREEISELMKAKDDEVVLGALNFLAILLTFILLWILYIFSVLIA